MGSKKRRDFVDCFLARKELVNKFQGNREWNRQITTS